MPNQQRTLEAERLELLQQERRAREDAESARGWLGVLVDTSRALSEAGLEHAELLDAAVRHIGAAVGDLCVIRLLSDDGHWLRTTAVYHRDPQRLALLREIVAHPLPADSWLSGQVVRTGKPLLLNGLGPDLITVDAPPEYRDYMERFETHSVIVVPLRVRALVIGTLSVSREQPREEYSVADQVLLQELADRVGFATENIRLYQESRAAEARYRHLFKGTADAVLVTDSRGRVLEANPVAATLLGYGPSELQGLRLHELIAAEASSVEAELARFTATGRWDGELELRRKDGATVPVEVRASAIPLPCGPAYVSVLRDISERRALERLQREFLAMVSHELRNPLTAIRGYAQVMERKRAFDERSVEVIQHQAQRVDRMVGDLLDLARLDAGRFELRRECVELVALARSCAERAGVWSEQHVVRFETSREAIQGQWDPGRLEQVLDNLLSNAIKYSPGGGEVEVRLEELEHEVRVSVTDQGPGVPPPILPRLFERFSRAEAHGDASEGLGLGLHITRALVEAHGGRIWVGSQPGQGATFSFALPYDQQTQQGTQSALLSPRQLDVARLVARGYTNARIAEELVITKGTVSNHVEHILTRLGLRNRAELARWVTERGLLEPFDAA